MDSFDERILVYTSLLMLCSFAGALIGLQAAIWSFLQIAVVIEVLYWLGVSPDTSEHS